MQTNTSYKNSVSTIEQLKLMAEVSDYPYTKFSRKEYPFLSKSITIDVAGNILYHQHQKVTPQSPKTLPSSLIGDGSFKDVKELFNEDGTTANMVRATYFKIPNSLINSYGLLHLIKGKRNLLPGCIACEWKIDLNEQKEPVRTNSQLVVY